MRKRIWMRGRRIDRRQSLTAISNLGEKFVVVSAVEKVWKNFFKMAYITKFEKSIRRQCFLAVRGKVEDFVVCNG